MKSVQSVVTPVVAEILRRQPSSPGRTTLAWLMVVGPGLARVTSVALEGTTLRVSATDDRWLKEISRARATIIPKLQQLLGADQITRLTTS
jgi:hypothetical protein